MKSVETCFSVEELDWVESTIRRLWAIGFRTKGKIINALEIIARRGEFTVEQMAYELYKLNQVGVEEKSMSKSEMLRLCSNLRKAQEVSA